MIFTTAILSLPQATVNPFQTVKIDDIDYSIVTHNNTICQVGNSMINCGTDINQLQLKLLDGETLHQSYPQLPNGKGLDVNKAYENFPPVSLDFYHNDICVVSQNGYVACGSQDQGLTMFQTPSQVYTLVQFDAEDVKQVQFSVDGQFLCMLNWNDEMWCFPLTRNEQKQLVFYQGFDQYQMKNLGDVDTIRFDFVITNDFTGNNICGHPSGGEKNELVCITLDGNWSNGASRCFVGDNDVIDYINCVGVKT
eukprot:NODE_346_length_9038_cov_0.304508.p3 type:complete len:252 gc:universal NODE_346_length_9038_cov_0.304508:5161-5916(+)